MSHVTPAAIIDNSAERTDPRVSTRTSHRFIDIITIDRCGAICGADTWPEIEAYGKTKEEWLRTYLELPNGIPTRQTFRRLFIALASDEFEKCFLKWIQSAFKSESQDMIPIDGKTLRRSHDRASGKSPMYRVSAWRTTRGIALGQIKTDEKSNGNHSDSSAYR